MKLTCTLLLSVLLLVVQCFGVAPFAGSASGATPVPHSCCPRSEAVHCAAPCCVTAPTPTPAGQPLPATHHQTLLRGSFETPALLGLLWSLPLPSDDDASPSASHAPHACGQPDLPLFLRHAVLLI